MVAVHIKVIISLLFTEHSRWCYILEVCWTLMVAQNTNFTLGRSFFHTDLLNLSQLNINSKYNFLGTTTHHYLTGGWSLFTPVTIPENSSWANPSYTSVKSTNVTGLNFPDQGCYTLTMGWSPVLSKLIFYTDHPWPSYSHSWLWSCSNLHFPALAPWSCSTLQLFNFLGVSTWASSYSKVHTSMWVLRFKFRGYFRPHTPVQTAQNQLQFNFKSQKL